jgi:hypothetical protein
VAHGGGRSIARHDVDPSHPAHLARAARFMSARFSPCGLRCADPGRTCGRRRGAPDCYCGDDRQRMEEQERHRAPYIQMRRALETENVAEFLHAVCSGILGSNEAVTIARPARMAGVSVSSRTLAVFRGRRLCF